MEEALLALIRGDAGVQSLLSDRINWVRRPQADSTFPACTLTRVDGLRNYDTKAPAGLVETRIQVDVWGTSYGSAKLATRAILSVVNGYKGGIFQGIFIDGETDMPDETNDANVRLFRVRVDLQAWHTE